MREGAGRWETWSKPDRRTVVVGIFKDIAFQGSRYNSRFMVTAFHANWAYWKSNCKCNVPPMLQGVCIRSLTCWEVMFASNLSLHHHLLKQPKPVPVDLNPQCCSRNDSCVPALTVQADTCFFKHPTQVPYWAFLCELVLSNWSDRVLMCAAKAFGHEVHTHSSGQQLRPLASESEVHSFPLHLSSLEIVLFESACWERRLLFK